MKKNFFLFFYQLMDDVRISSVICDERYDNQVCRVDGEGFHPHFLYVTKVILTLKLILVHLKYASLFNVL